LPFHDDVLIRFPDPGRGNAWRKISCRGYGWT
jgi:hypothetical protein